MRDELPTYRVILEPLDLLVDDLLDLALLILAQLASQLLLVADLVLQTEMINIDKMIQYLRRGQRMRNISNERFLLSTIYL